MARCPFSHLLPFFFFFPHSATLSFVLVYSTISMKVALSVSIREQISKFRVFRNEASESPGNFTTMYCWQRHSSWNTITEKIWSRFALAKWITVFVHALQLLVLMPIADSINNIGQLTYHYTFSFIFHMIRIINLWTNVSI